MTLEWRLSGCSGWQMYNTVNVCDVLQWQCAEQCRDIKGSPSLHTKHRNEILELKCECVVPALKEMYENRTKCFYTMAMAGRKGLQDRLYNILAATAPSRAAVLSVGFRPGFPLSTQSAPHCSTGSRRPTSSKVRGAAAQQIKQLQTVLDVTLWWIRRRRA